jgi:hypothetical protein
MASSTQPWQITSRACSGGRAIEVASESDPDVIASLDPAAADYDPYQVSQSLRVFPHMILEKERAAKRDASFAGPREDVLRGLVGTRLGGVLENASSADVACYVSSCEVTISLSNESDDLIDQALVAMQTKPFPADAVQPMVYGPHGKKRLWFGLLYSRELRSHDQFAAWLQRRENDSATEGPRVP